MSHQVQINYEAIAIQCNSICEVAEKQLKELDRLLAEIESESKQLLNEQTRALKRQILSERESLLEEMKQLRERADRRTLSSTREATNLQKRVNELASQKIIAFEETLRTLLGDKLQDNQRKLLERSNGVITIDEQTQKLLDRIQDVALRQFVYIAYLKDNTLSGDALLKAGQALMGQTYESRMQEEQVKIRTEMEAARVDKATIDKVVTEGKTIAEIRENATTEIVGEKVRQKSLKIIMDAVQKRGFIVDKKNIKINREKNEVILVALKASGEKAEFKVYLDGRFIYDFRGYEGQACQKDIEPFMKDLEEVYGIHVTKTQEIWRNPDKISTMKYQTFNTNKNKQ